VPSACQRGQPLPERRVQPLDVRRVDHPCPLCPTPERLHTRRRALHDAALDVDDTPLGVALHDLCDADIAPGAQPGTPVGSRPDRIAEGLTGGVLKQHLENLKRKFEAERYAPKP